MALTDRADLGHGQHIAQIVPTRIARLSIHAANTAALFLIETWQRKSPARPLPKADDLGGQL